jgi:PAS domain S-box-containing protein
MVTEPTPIGQRRRDWLSCLLKAGPALTAGMDAPNGLSQLARLLVPEFVELCAIHVLDEYGQLALTAIRHATATLDEAAGALADNSALADEHASLVAALVRDGVPPFTFSTEHERQSAWSPGRHWARTAAAFGISSAVVAPLVVHGRAFGALTLAATGNGTGLADDDQRPIEELARQIAVMLDGASLREAAQAHRREADQTRCKMAFLADASATLADSLDYNTTLKSVSRLAVPLIADCCMVRIVEVDGSVCQAAVAHADPDLQRLIQPGGSQVLPDIWGPSPLAAAIRTGQTIVLDAIGDEVLIASAQNSDQLAQHRRLGFTASLTIPLQARGRRIGALTFATANPDRAFNHDDIALGQDLARRAAVAIDNARLHGDILAGRDNLARHFAFTDTIVRHIAEGVAVVDQNARLTYINPIAEQTLGVSAVDVIGRPFHEIVHVHDASGAELATDECHLRGVHSCNWNTRLEDESFRRADGTTFPVALSASPLPRHGELAGAVIIFRDVSQERQAREQLRESEERLRRALSAAQMMMWERDLTTGRTVRSDLATSLFGRPNAELLDDDGNAERFVHPDDRDELRRQTALAIETGRPVEVEYRVVWPDNSVHWMRGRGQAAYDDAGRPLRMSGTTLDVTERKLAQLYLEQLLAERQAEAEQQRQLHEQLRRSLDAVLGLHEVGKLLTATSNLDAAGCHLLAIAVRAARLQAAAISLRDRRGLFRIWQRIGPDAGIRWNRRHPAALKARARAVDSGLAQTYAIQPRRAGGLARVGWCVPLAAKDGVLGVLEAIGLPRQTGEPTAEILGSIASQASSALENARLYREVAASERQLHRLVQQLMSAQEEERARLAHEVHDEVVQTATGAQQFLEAYAFAFPGRSEQEREQLATAIGLARQIVVSIRRVLGGLRPTLLDDFGLARGLQAHAERLSADGLTVEYQTSLGGERLAPEVEIAVFRLAQEALTNVGKHAGTHQAQLRLERHGDRLILEVQDRGRGFDPAVMGREDGSGARLGLLGMRERIAQIGGTMTISSSRESGTLVRAEVPLQGRISDWPRHRKARP